MQTISDPQSSVPLERSVLLCPERNSRIEYYTIKSKLRSVVKEEAICKTFEEYALLAHRAMERAFAFFRLYCLSLPEEEELPDISESTMKQCLNQVCTKNNRGAKLKDGALEEKLRTFWKDRFCKIHPDKSDLTGKSRLKAILAEQMCSNVLVDCKTHFRSRLFRLVMHLLRGDADKRHEASKAVASAFSNDWENMEPRLRNTLRKVLPDEIEKGSISYDLKKSPGKYVACTKQICKILGNDCKMQFLPSRRSWVPCHVKFDTESILQMFTPSKRRLEWRRSFGEDRKAFNDSVWGTILKCKKVESKSRNFSFHHELSTDGVAVSLLYSRVSARGDKECPCDTGRETSTPTSRDEDKKDKKDRNLPPGRTIGLDPGKKNILTMADSDGNSMRYTACQRNFEGKLVRYRKVLSEEKEKKGIKELETHLSMFEGRSNDPLKYEEYLKARVHGGGETDGKFLWAKEVASLQFRMYCNRKSSEQRLLNRIAEDCEIMYGNWSRKTQMKGCQPTPNATLKSMLSKRFRVTTVDEFRTSITCNSCMGTLKSYRTRSGKLSRSRLYCESCGGENRKLSKRFVDR